VTYEVFQVPPLLGKTKKKTIIERGKLLVQNGKTGRAAANELYSEYFANSNVQPSQRERRLKHLARKFKTT
jgi:hypothetical protein